MKNVDGANFIEILIEHVFRLNKNIKVWIWKDQPNNNKELERRSNAAVLIQNGLQYQQDQCKIKIQRIERGL